MVLEVEEEVRVEIGGVGGVSVATPVHHACWGQW